MKNIYKCDYTHDFQKDVLFFEDGANVHITCPKYEFDFEKTNFFRKHILALQDYSSIITDLNYIAYIYGYCFQIEIGDCLNVLISQCSNDFLMNIFNDKFLTEVFQKVLMLTKKIVITKEDNLIKLNMDF